MAYLVLARKYRPQTFAEMTGQEHVVRTLANALKSGHLAHAFLFTGPRGVADAEKIALSDSALGQVARAAEGGMRDALSLLDQVRAAVGDAPSDAAVADAVGAVDPTAVARIGAALVRRDGGAVLAELDG